MSALGLTVFFKAENARLRVAGLGLLFPGAGFVALGTIPAFIALVLTLVGVPVSLFLWFGCGGLAFPIALWSGSLLFSVILAEDAVVESAGALVTTFCALGLTYLTWRTQMANREAERRRDKRNTFLADAVNRNQTAAAAPPAPGSREADERTLRFLQWVLEMGLTPKDDFTYHDVIDQFQTAAIRYQLYQSVYELCMFQGNYCPNFHGYLSRASRGLIEKSLREKVMG